MTTQEEATFDYNDLKRYVRQYLGAVRSRIEATNRAGSRDAGVPEEILKMHKAIEAMWLRGVRQAYRQVVPEPIQKWQRESPGIGDLLLAELLGLVGNPLVAVPRFYTTVDGEPVLATGEPYPRSVRQLYAYVGHGDVTRRRRRGMSADDVKKAGVPDAKRTVHLMALSVVKVGEGPYLELYYGWKQHYTDKYPEWNKGHAHNSALRKVAKAILKDLWRVAAGQEPMYGGDPAWRTKYDVKAIIVEAKEKAAKAKEEAKAKKELGEQGA